jgi:hypothetical protein
LTDGAMTSVNDGLHSGERVQAAKVIQRRILDHIVNTNRSDSGAPAASGNISVSIKDMALNEADKAWVRQEIQSAHRRHGLGKLT